MNDTERWIQGILKVQTKILDQNVALLKSQTGIMEDLKALSQRLGNVERALSIKNDTTLDSPNCPITMNMEQLKKRILELEIEKPFLASQGGPSSISFDKSEPVSSTALFSKRKSMTPAQDRLKKSRM